MGSRYSFGHHARCLRPSFDLDGQPKFERVA